LIFDKRAEIGKNGPKGPIRSNTQTLMERLKYTTLTEIFNQVLLMILTRFILRIMAGSEVVLVILRQKLSFKELQH
jgi:hypothetical protein